MDDNTTSSPTTLSVLLKNTFPIRFFLLLNFKETKLLTKNHANNQLLYVKENYYLAALSSYN